MKTATNEKNIRFWITALIIGAVAFAPLYQLKELIMKSDALVQQTVGTAFDMWQKLAFTFVLIASFILLYQKKGFSKDVSSLRYYGKMSLTNYITQSILGAIIYFPFGLYLAPYCGYTLSLLIGFVLFLLQVKFSKWWLSKHKQGPLEHIWHKWTWIGSSRANKFSIIYFLFIEFQSVRYAKYLYNRSFNVISFCLSLNRSMSEIRSSTFCLSL
ncbi:MAG: DUF418 domain-containing protein [Bacteroides cellulosilyticus]|nr:DUF418 domain-containing protein [Bacteroides cellulosilyticus]